MEIPDSEEESLLSSDDDKELHPKSRNRHSTNVSMSTNQPRGPSAPPPQDNDGQAPVQSASAKFVERKQISHAAVDHLTAFAGPAVASTATGTERRLQISEPLADTVATTRNTAIFEPAPYDSQNRAPSPAPALPSSETTPPPSPRTASVQSAVSDLRARRSALLDALSCHPLLPSALQSNHAATSEMERAATASSKSILDEDALVAAAESIVRRHIALLHSYNEIRDVGLGLMGLIADGRGVRLRDVLGEFGVQGDD